MRNAGRQESRKGISEIEGKAARVAAKKRGLRLSFKAGKDRGFECGGAFDSLAPGHSVCRSPVHVARVPAAPFCETPRHLAQTPYNLITECFFSVVRGRQCIFADCDCGRAGVLDLVGLDSVELDVFCEFGRNVCVRIDGVHRANLYAGHAIDTVVGMNHHLAIHLVEARHRTDFYAVGEFASVTFLGHNMGHSASVINSGLGEKTLL